MKTFQLIISFALIAASMAFAPNQSPQCKSSRCQRTRKRKTVWKRTKRKTQLLRSDDDTKISSVSQLIA